jgi:hypothetical protein
MLKVATIKVFKILFPTILRMDECNNIARYVSPLIQATKALRESRGIALLYF